MITDMESEGMNMKLTKPFYWSRRAVEQTGNESKNEVDNVVVDGAFFGSAAVVAAAAAAVVAAAAADDAAETERRV